LSTYALISDIHGNIDALRAVAEDLEHGPPIDEIICLGDIIGYCPASNEVIDLLRSMEEGCRIRYNLGSHDGAALGAYQFVDMNNAADAEALRAAGLETEAAVAAEYFDAEKRRFVPVRAEARDAMKWTLEHLSDESLEFLRQRLQPVIQIAPGILSVHGSPRDPACEYVRDSGYAARCFESPAMASAWLCFVGHTHLPVVWRLRRADLVEMAGNRVCMKQPGLELADWVELNRTACRYIVNVGSVGQPRDHDRRACYGRFSTKEDVFAHVRVEYDVDAAAARVRAAGFSERLAERLYQGE